MSASATITPPTSADVSSSESSPARPITPTIDAEQRNIAVLLRQDHKSTPSKAGLAARSKHFDGMDIDAIKYYRLVYERDIAEDLRTSRVFVHFDDFLHVVLRVPRDWDQQEEYKKLVDVVLDNTDFKESLQQYLAKCDEAGQSGDEKVLYAPRSNLQNAALAVLDKEDDDSFRFQRFDPKRLQHGVSKAPLSPDVVSFFCSYLKPLKLPQIATAVIGGPSLAHMEEVKGTWKALFDGRQCARICKGGIKGGADPKTEHATPAKIEKPRKATDDIPSKYFMEDRPDLDEEQSDYEEAQGEFDDWDDSEEVDTDKSGNYTGSSSSKKRKCTTSTGSAKKVLRHSETQETPHSRHFAEGEPRPTGKCHDVQIQCGAYAMEATAISFLRSHYIMSLIDRECLQLKVFTSVGIVDSSSISVRTLEGQRSFVAMVLGLRRLSLEDRGFRGDLIKASERFHQQCNFLKSQLTQGGGKSGVPMHWKHLLWNMYVDETLGDYRIQEILYRQPGLVGRLSCVVRAVDKEDSSKVVIIKGSRPCAGRRAEWELVAEARNLAKKLKGNDHWVLRHLPLIIRYQDKAVKEGSLDDRLGSFLNNSAYVGDKAFSCEYRVFRTLVLEELYAIDTLDEPKAIAQVFLDILQCHNWLWVYPGILHRDISMSNIMYRIGPTGAVYGVLNDMDLSSYRKDLDAKKATALDRTGTAPFMAYDLLRDSPDKPTPHLYRHDLESLFTVILMLVCRHRLPDPPKASVGKHQVDTKLSVPARKLKNLNEKDAPFAEWFKDDASWKELYTHKESMFRKPLENSVHETFSGFKEWIKHLRTAFKRGFQARDEFEDRDIPGLPAVSEDMEKFLDIPGEVDFVQSAQTTQAIPETFDNETLGGHVNYRLFARVMWTFNDEQLTMSYERETVPGYRALT